MKCIFQFWSCSPHLEASLEIAMNEVTSGNEVAYYWGGDDVLFADNNGQGRLGSNFKSQKPIYKAIRLLKQKIGNQICFRTSWVNYADVPNLELSFQSLEDVLNFEYDNFEVGRAAISSLSQLFLTDLTKHDIRQFVPMLEEVIFSGIGVYISALKILEEQSADQVYLFNGRFIHESAVYAAADKLGVKASFHERGSTLNKYALTDYLAHDLAAIYQNAQEVWERELTKSNEVVREAKSYMDNRIYSAKGAVAGAWKNFTQCFDRDMSIEQLRSEVGICTDEYIVFFQTSDDEFAAVSQSVKVATEWNMQEQIVSFIAETLKENTSLVVRMHPHMNDKNRANLKSWLDLKHALERKSSQIKFVWSDSNINSYLLAVGSEKVICCGSTIGAEAIYLGKQTICCGAADWSQVEGATQVLCYDELLFALQNECNVNPESVLPIAYRRSTFGEDYKYFRSTGLYSGEFLGVDLFNGQSYLP